MHPDPLELHLDQLVDPLPHQDQLVDPPPHLDPPEDQLPHLDLLEDLDLLPHLDPLEDLDLLPHPDPLEDLDPPPHLDQLEDLHLLLTLLLILLHLDNPELLLILPHLDNPELLLTLLLIPLHLDKVVQHLTHLLFLMAQLHPLLNHLWLHSTEIRPTSLQISSPLLPNLMELLLL